MESRALTERSQPGSDTVFTALDATAAGLGGVNRYADARIWTSRYHEFSVGAIGTGVAVGDFDGDGRPDLFVVHKTESSRLYRNLGSWRFEDVTASAGLLADEPEAREWKQGVAFVDVNNDGWLDLYLCRFAAANQLWINQGNGTFREEAVARGVAVVDASGMAAFCDYDRDGWLDFYLQTNVLDKRTHPAGQPDRLFHNRGDGTFEEVTVPAGIGGESQGHSATWWDFDHDGWPDLYVANDFSVRDHLYRNRGDGTFADVIDAVVPVMPHHAMGAGLGDADGDGDLDLFVAEMARPERAAELATAAETRTGSVEEELASGRPDQTMRNVLLLDGGAGGIEEAAWLAGLEASGWTWSPRWADFDNDGREELHITNGMVRCYDSYDLRAQAMAAESSAQRVRVMMNSPVLEEANLLFHRASDTLQFDEVGQAWGLDQVGVNFGSATADFDGDGDLDLVAATYQGPVALWRNDSQRGHRILVDLRGTTSNRFGIGAEVTLRLADRPPQVRQLASAQGYLSTSEPVVHFGLGAADQVESLTVRWPSGAVQVLHNLAADRRYLITEVAGNATPSPSTVTRLEQEELPLIVPERDWNELGRQPLTPRRLEHRGPFALTADFDGDGRDDVLVGGNPESPRQLWLADPTGSLVRGDEVPDWTRVGQLADGPMVAIDVDGDGQRDVVITKAGMNGFAHAPDYQPIWLRNEGSGRFSVGTPSLLPEFRENVGSVVAGDFDGDGHEDLFLGGRVVPGQYPVSPESVLWWGTGHDFAVEASNDPGFARQGMVTAAVATDVDGDGAPDLVVATEWGTLRGWRNAGGRRWEDCTDRWGLAAGGRGFWSALLAVDVNHDGRPDLMAGNLGLNSPYCALVRLYAGDFRGDGRGALIEATQRGDDWVPRRARSDLARVVRGLAQRFPTTAAYADASLAELVGEAPLRRADIWEIDQLQNGVFLSQPDGRYAFRPWPHRAQIAPVTGLAATDLDGDGNMDLLVTHNVQGMARDIGRLAGGHGMTLAGDGTGAFEPMSFESSGWVVPGVAAGVLRLRDETTDTDRLLVPRNQRSWLLFAPSDPSRKFSFLVPSVSFRAASPPDINARLPAGHLR